MKNHRTENYKHQIELNVRFMDLDALHHVNNARYLNFLEEGRIAYSQEVLGLFNRIDEFNVLVARVEIDFIRPIAFGEKVTVYTKVSKLGTKSFVFDSLICASSKGEEKVCAHALQTIVAFDPKSNSSIEIPQSLKDQVQSYEPLL